LYTMLKLFLSRAAPSWTIWFGIAWAVLSGLPDVLTTIVGWFGPATPEMTAKVVAITLVIARLRSLLAPLADGIKPLADDIKK